MNSKVFIFILIVALIVSAGVVLFYAKRHPNPYFRPKRGEVALMSIFMVLLSGGFSFMLAQLFESDINLQKSKEEENSVIGAGAANSDAFDSPTPRRSEGGGSGGSGGSTPDPSLPPFLQK